MDKKFIKLFFTYREKITNLVVEDTELGLDCGLGGGLAQA